MTPDDVIDVLAKAAAFDQRTAGKADVLAWHEVLHRLDLRDALEAVTRHYTESRDRLMPADVVRHVRTIRDERRRERHHEVLALPSRFESDEERDERMKAGAAKVREVIAPLVARMAFDHPPAFVKSIHGPQGAWWEDEAARERHCVELLGDMGRLRAEQEAI